MTAPLKWDPEKLRRQYLTLKWPNVSAFARANGIPVSYCRAIAGRGKWSALRAEVERQAADKAIERASDKAADNVAKQIAEHQAVLPVLRQVMLKGLFEMRDGKLVRGAGGEPLFKKDLDPTVDQALRATRYFVELGRKVYGIEAADAAAAGREIGRSAIDRLAEMLSEGVPGDRRRVVIEAIERKLEEPRKEG